MERGYYGNGQVSYERERNSQGQKHGTIKWWYEGGQLERETTYRNGKEHGIRREWNKDGVPRVNEYYLYGYQLIYEEYEAEVV